MNNEPVAWLWVHKGTTMNALLRNPMCDEYGKKHFEPKGWSSIPLYTHPHPDNLGLAESIIKQQELQIKALKAENKFFKDLMSDVEILKGKK